MQHVVGSKRWFSFVLGASLGAALLVAARPAEACSCLASTVESSYQNSSAVLSARVLLSFGAGSERWSLARVSKAYKGCTEPGELVVLSTASSSAACGVSLPTGMSTPAGEPTTAPSRKSTTSMTPLFSLITNWSPTTPTCAELPSPRRSATTPSAPGSTADS